MKQRESGYKYQRYQLDSGHFFLQFTQIPYCIATVCSGSKRTDFNSLGRD